MMKKLIAALAVVTLLAPAALADAPTVKKVQYEGTGRVEVDFRQDVRYENPGVTVKDSAGASYEAVITKKDEDDLTFRITGFKQGQDYTFELSGVRRVRTTGYGTVSGAFRIPEAGKVTVKEVSYDHDDRELDIEFDQNVTLKSAKVTLTDASCRTVAIRSIKRGNDELDIRMRKRLSLGQEYTYTITGVRLYGESQTQSVSGTFVAYDD